MPYAKRPLKRNGRPQDDQKAPDGFTVNGWRQIHKGGYVRVQGTRHYHAKFAEWVGLWVFVEIYDGWALNVNAWSDEPWKDPRTMLACTAEKDWFADKIDHGRFVSRAHQRTPQPKGAPSTPQPADAEGAGPTT